MNSMDAIRIGIQENVSAILQRFDTIVADEEPWLLLPATRRTDHFGELIVRLADVALRAAPRKEHVRRMLHAAATHGEDRLRSGFPESLVFREHYLLREALWSQIREQHEGENPLAFEAVVRIDAALSLAAKASIRGFHRSTYEAQGNWPDCIEDLCGDWRPLPRLE